MVTVLSVTRLKNKLLFQRHFKKVTLQSLYKLQTLFSSFTRLNHEEQMSLLCKFFSYHCATAHDVNMPNDYLPLSVCAIKNLRTRGKLNVLYELARGFGTMRSDQSDTCFPMTRMPFGMLEYMATFFNSTPGSNVRLN